MNIIFSEERMPGQAVIEKMKEAGRRCLLRENLDEERTMVSVTFVGEEEIHALNREYRNVDKVTDVLSFPQYDDLKLIPDTGEICLGDVVICSEQALLQADDFGHTPEREIVYLFVHSVLHLMGYDHLEDEDKDEMREFEESIMSEIDLER